MSTTPGHDGYSFDAMPNIGCEGLCRIFIELEIAGAVVGIVVVAAIKLWRYLGGR